jgi:hypothetical protein
MSFISVSFSRFWWVSDSDFCKFLVQNTTLSDYMETILLFSFCLPHLCMQQVNSRYPWFSSFKESPWLTTIPPTYLHGPASEQLSCYPSNPTELPVRLLLTCTISLFDLTLYLSHFLVFLHGHVRIYRAFFVQDYDVLA